jgi:hypothetical protein
MVEDLIGKIANQKRLVDQIKLPEVLPIHGQSVAPRFKVEVFDSHKVVYDDVPHLYFLEYPNGYRAPLISVTTLLALLSPGFDSAQQALNCARKKDYNCNCLDKTDWNNLPMEVKQDRIMAAWEQNAQEAALYGTTSHGVMEHLTIFPEQSVDTAYQVMTDHFQCYNEIIKSFGHDYIAKIRDPFIAAGYSLIAEPLLFDFDIMTAGQGDLVAVHHENKLIHILDHKSNKKCPEKKGHAFNNMNHPFNKVPDTSYYHYVFQICLYQRFILKRYPGYIAGVNYILWKNRETGLIEVIPVDPTEFQVYIDTIYKMMIEYRPQIYGF